MKPSQMSLSKSFQTKRLWSNNLPEKQKRDKRLSFVYLIIENSINARLQRLNETKVTVGTLVDHTHSV